jgi:hypothetical protein
MAILKRRSDLGQLQIADPGALWAFADCRVNATVYESFWRASIHATATTPICS